MFLSWETDFRKKKKEKKKKSEQEKKLTTLRLSVLAMACAADHH